MYSFKIELSRKGFNLSRFLPVHEVIPNDSQSFKSLKISLNPKYVPDYFNENEVYETEYEAKMEFNKKIIEVTNQMTQRAQNLLTKIENLKKREYNL